MTRKLNILFVRPTLGYGGADRVTLNLLQGFDRTRFSCDLALMRAEGDFIEDLPSDVSLFDLNARSLWFMWTPLYKLFKRGKYDVIYSTCGGASMPMMLAAILSRYKGVKVVSERNILFPPNKSKFKRKLMLTIKKRLYSKATWVTAVSKGVKIECEEILKVPANRALVVNNPILNETLEKGKEEEITHEFFQKYDKLVLAVGRFEWQKDYDTLFKAFEPIAKMENVGLFILGKGPLLSRFEQLAQDLGIEDSVCFAGFDKNPFKYMKSSSVFVLSSQHEGMPGVLIQALASGAACVSTDCRTGPNEIIEHGENGLLVPVGNSAMLGDAISELLHNSNLNEKFRRNGPESVSAFREEPAIESYFNFLTK